MVSAVGATHSPPGSAEIGELRDPVAGLLGEGEADPAEAASREPSMPAMMALSSACDE